MAKDAAHRRLWQIFEAVDDTLVPLSAAGAHQQAIHIALKQPGRRIGRIRLGQYHDHDGHIGPGHEGLHAVQQRGFTGHPPELLELAAPGS